MRLFTAIPMTVEIKNNLSAIHRDISGLKWIPFDQLHMTLKFIGRTRLHVAGELMTALESVEFESFEITVRSLGCFPSKASPSVLWAGVEAPRLLFDLQSQVAEIAEKYGAKHDRFTFKPHVTIARIDATPGEKIMNLMDEFEDLEAGKMKVRRFILYKSELHSGGATYTIKRAYECR